MKYLLALRQQAWLAELLQENLLLAFDFEGTLTPTVIELDEAVPRDETLAVLASLAARYPVAVLAEGPVEAVRAHLRGVPVRFVVGRHGAETEEDLPPTGMATASFVAERAAELSRRLADASGVSVADRRRSVVVRYHEAKDKDVARAHIAEAVATAWPEARVVPGKQQIHLFDPAASDKGAAVLDLLTRSGCERVLYAGDDTIDEDVFALRDPRVLSVRVQKSSRTAAEHYVHDQREIDALLQVLLAARAAAPGT